VHRLQSGGGRNVDVAQGDAGQRVDAGGEGEHGLHVGALVEVAKLGRPQSVGGGVRFTDVGADAYHVGADL
jgi:hypothetical protein